MNRSQQLVLLGLVFAITYVIPLIALILLKALGFINDFQVRTIKERRFPVLFMIVLFYLLGNTIVGVISLRDLGFLFYGTSLSLLFTYLLFSVKLKSSLHLLSMGSAVSFFLIISNKYYAGLIPIIVVLILLSGLLASSRLHLKAHTPKELLIGFLLGFVGQLAVFFIL